MFIIHICCFTFDFSINKINKQNKTNIFFSEIENKTKNKKQNKTKQKTKNKNKQNKTKQNKQTK